MAEWTRSAKLYQGLENKLFISATFHSDALRRAFALEFPDIYGHGGEITRRELVDVDGSVHEFHNFFVAMYTPDIKWNDLAKRDSIWHLSLTDSSDSSDSSGASVAPAEVESVKLDANIQAVYQHLNKFDRAYLVRFPKIDLLGKPVLASDTRRFTLRIASALGASELTWELVGLPVAPSEAISKERVAEPKPRDPGLVQ